MIVAIHQPNYLPYLGFFDKMKISDIFVIYDDAYFNDRDYHHRNKIRTGAGWQWLTVPVENEKTSINQIKIKKIKDWQMKHLSAIRGNYLKAKYFDIYSNILEQIYQNNHEYLIDLNMELINFIKNAFNIKTKIILSSKFGINSTSTMKLIDIVKACGGDTYISGPGGTNYMDITLFKELNINLIVQNFNHPVYAQRHEGFIPNMSAIDILFNMGTFISVGEDEK